MDYTIKSSILFDLGIGRAITKIIAEKLGKNELEEIPGLFWTSFFLILSISVACAVILFFLSPVFVYKIFNISQNLQAETLNTFYILALSIPVVTTTASIRGFLEAYQKFRSISIIRTILGVCSFLVPLIVLFFTKNLFLIVIFLVMVRIIIWILYMSQCFKINSGIKNKFYFKINFIKPILKLSGWMTVSNITVPIIIYMDRFIIGAIVSAAAITYYATPYEVVTKLLIIPGALTGVLFPTFSATYLNNPDYTKKLLLKAVKYIFIFLFPIVTLIITFAGEGLNLWLGAEFAQNSSFILRFLAAGVLINSLTYIPFAFLEGIGRPDITAKVQLIELPFYLFFMWMAIKQAGIDGAAFAWLTRMVFDSAILFYFVKKQIAAQFKYKFKMNHLFILILIAASIITPFVFDIIFKSILALITLLSFSYISWKFLLMEEERVFLLSKLIPNTFSK